MATKAKKLALVIGIGEYNKLNSLSNPVNDATDIASVLESIGFTVIMELNLKCIEMKHILLEFENSIESGDTVLFYFAGHGIQWEVCINLT